MNNRKYSGFADLRPKNNPTSDVVDEMRAATLRLKANRIVYVRTCYGNPWSLNFWLTSYKEIGTAIHCSSKMI